MEKRHSGFFFSANNFMYISHFPKNNKSSILLYFERTNQFYENRENIFLFTLLRAKF